VQDCSRVTLLAVDLSTNQSIAFGEFADFRCHAFADLPGEKATLCGEGSAYAKPAVHGSDVCGICMTLVLSWAARKHESPAILGARHPEA
jgi:hypothetical protein